MFGKLKLEVNEFIRRFLLHLLPKGFFKVRYYGIFANAHRKANIEKANKFLLEESQEQKQETIEDGRQVWEKRDTVWTEIMQDIKTHAQHNCPVCKKGRMRFVGMVAEPTVVTVALE